MSFTQIFRILFHKVFQSKTCKLNEDSLPPLTDENNGSFYRAHQRLVQLEELITNVSHSKAIVGNDIKKGAMSSPYRKYRLQKLSMGVRINSGW